MIQLISSFDNYKTEQHLKKVAEQLDVKPIIFDALEKSFSLELVYFEMISVDMFSPTKLIVIKNFFALSSKEKLNELDETMIDKMVDASNDVHLIFILDNLKFDSKKRAVKKLKEKGETISFEAVDLLTIRQMINQANKKYSFGLNNVECERFIQLCTTTQAAMNAIEKFKLVEGKITAELLELLIEENSDSRYFELSNAIFDKKFDEAFNLIEELKRHNVDLIPVIYYLTPKIRQLFQAKVLSQRGFSTDEIAKHLKIKSSYAWVLTNTLKNRYTKQQCLQILRDCSQFDRQSKIYMIDRNLQFELWLYQYRRNYGKS